MLRPMTLADVDDVLAVASELADKAYPIMKKDPLKMRIIANEIAGNPRHFGWVDEDECGNIRAILAAYTGDNAWAQRKYANVYVWWSDKPGRGFALLRKFAEWVTSRRAIKVAGFASDTDLPYATRALIQFAGFERHGGSYLLYN